MKTYDGNLLERLENWSPDNPDSPFPFSERLARENGWTKDYTDRVIREYKRFLFLAVAAGHPVSPSDEVDQAWHLHLLYTESYWGELCPNILGRALHHGPTKGGSSEKNKFNDWYQRTLNSYRQFFHEPPPDDIWPTPDRRFAEISFVRVSRSRHWVIPKPSMPIWNFSSLRSKVQRLNDAFGVGLFVMLAIVITLTGCGTDLGFTNGNLNPFNWSGRPFIFFFLILWATSAAIAGVLRYNARPPEDTVAAPTAKLEPYEIAFLGGGRNRVIFAAIASLAAKGAITIDEEKHRIYQRPLTNPLEPVEADIHRQIEPENKIDPDRSGSVYRTVAGNCNEFSIFTAIEQRLRALGLMTTPSERMRMTVIPALVALIAPAIGFIKVSVGVYRGKPFEQIFILSCISLVVALAFLIFRYRTPRGDALLEKLRNENANFEFPGRRADLTDSATASLVPMAVGLFGPSILERSELGDVEKKLQADLNSSAGGCGAAGCGSSGGDGGGGCGGGCGGCGGCG